VAANIKNKVLWQEIPCSLVDGYCLSFLQGGVRLSFSETFVTICQNTRCHVWQDPIRK